MIKQPDCDLAKKLEAINAKLQTGDAGGEGEPDAAELKFEHDKILAGAWRQLTGEARDAVDILLTNLEAQCVNVVQNPQITGDARTFAAGQLNIVYQIQANLNHFTTLEPKLEDYQQQFGDPDVVDGEGGNIIY